MKLVAGELRRGKVETKCSLSGVSGSAGAGSGTKAAWKGFCDETSWAKTSSELGQFPPRRVDNPVARSLVSSWG
jgi:hypothetical protein